MYDRPTPPPFTRHQWQIVQMLADGATTKEIGVRLEVSPSAVRSHLGNLYQLLDVPNAAALVSLVWRRGFMDEREDTEWVRPKLEKTLTHLQVAYADAVIRHAKSNGAADHQEVEALRILVKREMDRRRSA